jgi:hypothetical protein
MLCHVALVRTDVSEELRASIIKVTRIGEPGTTLAVTSNRQTASCHPDDGGAKFFETSVLTRATWLIPEDGILHSHRRENLKSYIVVGVCIFRRVMHFETIKRLSIPSIHECLNSLSNIRSKI